MATSRCQPAPLWTAGHGREGIKTLAMAKQCCNIPADIRNVSIIGGTGAGKSTLFDLVEDCACGGSEPPARTVLSAPESIKHGDSTTSVNIRCQTVCGLAPPAESDKEGDAVVTINLIDTPGHLDFEAETRAALSITEGALVVVDAINGICLATEYLLRQAIRESNQVTVFINKVDALLDDGNLSNEDIYQALHATVASINSLLASWRSASDIRKLVDPCDGTVVFGSLLQGWMISVPKVADSCNSTEGGSGTSKCKDKLWGDHYFDTESSKWDTRGKSPQRGFNYFILQRLREDFALAQDGWDSTTTVASFLQDMVIPHVPSPLAAAKDYAARFCGDSMASPFGCGIRDCDLNSELLVYVPKLLPKHLDGKTFSAIGRVLSGTLRRDQEVKAWVEKGCDTGKIKDISIMQGSRASHDTSEAAAGSIVCFDVDGEDGFPGVSGIITTSQDKFPLPLQYPPGPGISAVQCSFTIGSNSDDSDDSLRIEYAMMGLSRWNLSVKYDQIASGQYIITGTGRVHLDACCRYLEVMTAMTVTASPCQVHYCETAGTKSTETVKVMSSNKRITFRLSSQPYSRARPFDTVEVDEMNDPESQPTSNNTNERDNIWRASSESHNNPSVIVNETVGIHYVEEGYREPVSAGFLWATQDGLLVGGPILSTRFNLVDVAAQCDAIFRGSGQVIPAIRRAIYASFLLSSPTLMEPIALVEIRCSLMSAQLAALREHLITIITSYEGNVHEERCHGEQAVIVRAHVAFKRLLTLEEDLQVALRCQVTCQHVFDHWNAVPGDAFDPDSDAGRIVAQIRQWKGMQPLQPASQECLRYLTP